MIETLKKRSWKFYVGIALLALAVAGIGLVVAAVSYANHLVRTYTELAARAVPHVASSPEAREKLKARFNDFKGALEAGRTPQPFRLTGEDVNVFLSNFPEARDRVYVRVVDDRLEAQFCLPLDKAPQAKLNGRYLNGVATFHLVMEDGLLTLSVGAVEANRRPIPRWLLSRLQRFNLLQSLDGNLEVMGFLQRLESLQVQNGGITLIPAAR